MIYSDPCSVFFFCESITIVRTEVQLRGQGPGCVNSPDGNHDNDQETMIGSHLSIVNDNAKVMAKKLGQNSSDRHGLSTMYPPAQNLLDSRSTRPTMLSLTRPCCSFPSPQFNMESKFAIRSYQLDGDLRFPASTEIPISQRFL